MNRMKKWIAAGLTAALCLSLPACAGPAPERFGAELLAGPEPPQCAAFDDYETARRIREENPVEPALYAAVNAFCCEMTARVARGEENVLFSPLSLYYALALTARGARGGTGAELLRLLNGGEAAEAAAPDALWFKHGLYLPVAPGVEAPGQPGEPAGTGELASGGSVQVYASGREGELYAALPGGMTAYAFACGAYDSAALAAQLGNLYRRLYSDNRVSTLKIENALWLRAGADYQEAFLTGAAADFYASVYRVDFADPDTGKAMDAWLCRAADGQFSSGFVPDAEQVMSLFNTVLFSGEWVDRFDKNRTKPDTFTCADGTEKTADFMHMRHGSHPFAVGEGYTRSALSLKGAGEMVFILPDEGVSCAALLSGADRVSDAFFGGESRMGEVVWQVPKFTFEGRAELSAALKDVGAGLLFSPQADFSGMTGEALWMSGVTQQTRMSVDERGVQASAFTQLDYVGAAPPDGRAEMRLDRPFVYGIVVDGVLLFVGVCGDPTLAG